MLSEGLHRARIGARIAYLTFTEEYPKYVRFLQVNRAMFPFIDLAGHMVSFGGRALTPDDKRKYL